MIRTRIPFRLCAVLFALLIFLAVPSTANDPPIVVDDLFTEDASRRGRPLYLDVIANDQDADGDVLAVRVISTSIPIGASIDDTGDGGLLYTPSPGSNPSESFQYEIDDGQNPPVVGTVTISFTGDPPPPPPPPTALIARDDPDASNPGDERFMTPMDTQLVVSRNTLAENDEPEGEVVIQFASNPANGTLTQQLNPCCWIYEPNPGFVGTDTFTYTASLLGDPSVTDTPRSPSPSPGPGPAL